MADPKRPVPHTELKNFPKRIIAAGSRSYNNYKEFSADMTFAISQIHVPFVIISGDAHEGPDAMAIRYCKENDIPYSLFPADWKNINVPGAIVVYNRKGEPYNKRAGMDRNRHMAEVATDLMAWWDTCSPGTKEMIKLCTPFKLDKVVYLVNKDRKDEYA